MALNVFILTRNRVYSKGIEWLSEIDQKQSFSQLVQIILPPPFPPAYLSCDIYHRLVDALVAILYM